MDKQSPVLAIIARETDRDFYNQVAVSLGYPFANIFVGSPLEASYALADSGYSPKYIVIDIAARAGDVLPELDQLAQYCDLEARVIIVGATNDIGFYRSIIEKGVLEYLTSPATVDQIRAVLVKAGQEARAGGGIVVSFIGAAAGDGSSTIALNTAYALAVSTGEPTLLVDLDYQFGMVAKNLDIASPYGIKEIFEHPDRGIDVTLLERMVVPYKGVMDVIIAPNALQFLPPVSPELIRDLIRSFEEKYTYIILDMPHLWNHWVSTAITSSKHIVLTAQLSLKSVTHCSRLLNTWKQIGIQPQNLSVVINRSGSKFKEGVNPKDFERVCAHAIDFYISNDIKTIMKAENQGATIMELGSSSMANQFQRLSELLLTKLGTPKAGPVFKSTSQTQIQHQELKRLK